MKLYNNEQVPLPEYGQVVIFRSKVNGFLYYKKHSGETFLVEFMNGVYFIPDKTIVNVVNFTGETIETTRLDDALMIEFVKMPVILGGGGGSRGAQGFQGVQGSQGAQGSGVSQLSFQEFDLTYLNFQPNATNNSNYLMGTVPRGAVIVGAKLKATVRWASSSDTSAVMIVNGNDINGNPTSTAVINCTANLMNALDPRVGSYNLQFSPNKILDNDTPSDLYANVFVSGGAGNINLLTAGEAKVWLLIMQAF